MLFGEELSLTDYIDSVYAASPRIEQSQLIHRQWQRKYTAFEREFYPQLMAFSRYQFVPQNLPFAGYDKPHLEERFVQESSFPAPGTQFLSRLLDEQYATWFEEAPRHQVYAGIAMENPLWITHPRRDSFAIIETQTSYMICEWQLTQMEEKARATKMYYSVLLSRKKSSIYADLAAEKERLHKRTVDLFHGETRDSYDTLVTSIAYSNAMDDFRQAERQEELLFQEFLELGGFSEEQRELDLTDSLVQQQYGQGISAIEQTALAENKEILLKDIARDIAAAEYRQERTAFLPQFTWGVRAGVRTFPDSDISLQDHREAFFQVEYPLFTFGARVERLAEARYAKRIAELDYIEKKQDVLWQLRHAYTTYTEHLSAIERQDRAVSAALEALEIARLRFDNGVMTVEELNHRKEAYALQRLRRAQALYDLNNALIDMRLLVADYLYETDFVDEEMGR
ncbi:TolC family protein [Chitinivibrio alkaliphilus]|uniref:Outer membrane efflux protein n=1 Tax=Chitinivibrio alkaliphilus ACht1 TaxID=1313304 RepID=U7D6J4_9BACT|nr:TolC family protein [Chitinivibrio alkaliphilus]ERP31191.1 hypothetical protein CALK_1904 [Chitinivibrio alkaliphilus ACht1]